MVLPAPCKPHIRITVGGVEEKFNFTSFSPIRFVNSSFTILTTCCPGVRLSITSIPMALSLTVLIKSLTTLKLTSASNKASLTSLIATSTSFSESLPLPFNLPKAF